MDVEQVESNTKKRIAKLNLMGHRIGFPTGDGDTDDSDSLQVLFLKSYIRISEMIQLREGIYRISMPLFIRDGVIRVKRGSNDIADFNKEDLLRVLRFTNQVSWVRKDKDLYIIPEHDGTLSKRYSNRLGQ